MPLDFTKLECMKMTEEETLRLSQQSTNTCPNCGGTMTVGDEESAGICSSCCDYVMDEYTEDQNKI